MTILKKTSIVIIVATLGLAACSDGDAKQSTSHTDDHSKMEHNTMGNMPSNDVMTAMAMGRVISVDQSSGILTIEHGPIKALDWPTMTMPFMADPQHLTSVKKGDFVDMEMMAKPNKDGKYVLTNISPMNIDQAKLSKECLSKMDKIKSLDHNCMAKIRDAMMSKH